MSSTFARNVFLIIVVLVLVTGVSYCFQNEKTIAPPLKKEAHSTTDTLPPNLTPYERVLNFLMENPRLLKAEQFYDLDTSYLEQYKYNWQPHLLAKNPNVDWTMEYLTEMEDFVDWVNLQHYAKIPTTKEFFTKFQHRIDWDYLILNRNIKIDAEFLKDHARKIIGERRNFAWTPEMIKTHIDLLVPRKDSYLTSIQQLSKDEEQIIWSAEIIEAFKEEWDWISLSNNPELPLSMEFIDEFSDKWEWAILSQNKGIDFSEELLVKYEDLWSWKYLGQNHSLEISEALLKRFEDKWDWISLLSNSNVDVDAVFKNYSDKIIPHGLVNIRFGSKNGAKVINYLELDFFPEIEELIDKKEARQKYSVDYILDLWKQRCQYSKQKWGADFLEKYQKLHDWEILSGRDNLAWSDDLMTQFSDKWDWKILSANPAVDWTPKRIQRFADKLVWQNLHLKNTATFLKIKDQLIANNVKPYVYWEKVSQANLEVDFANIYRDSLKWEYVFKNKENAKNEALVEIYKSQFIGKNKRWLPYSFFENRDSLSEDFILNNLGFLRDEIHFEKVLKPYVDQNMIDKVLAKNAQKTEDIQYFELTKIPTELYQNFAATCREVRPDDPKIKQICEIKNHYINRSDFKFHEYHIEENKSHQLLISPKVKSIIERFNLPPDLKMEKVVLEQKERKLSSIFYQLSFENRAFNDYLIYPETSFEIWRRGVLVETTKKGEIKSKEEVREYVSRLNKSLKNLQHPYKMHSAQQETVVHPYDVLPSPDGYSVFMMSKNLKKALEAESDIQGALVEFKWHEKQWLKVNEQ